MGKRAGDAWRTTRAPVHNPFRHPVLHSLAALWRQGFIAAAAGDAGPGRPTVGFHTV
jgi:hypothetical protein